MDYDLSRLSSRSFEHLIQSLAVATLGLSTSPFGDGADGGREAIFDGRSKPSGRRKAWVLEHARGYHQDVEEGRWVVAARHRRRGWEVIVEPDETRQVLVVVTAYPLEEQE